MTKQELITVVEAVVDAWRKGQLGIPAAKEVLGRDLSQEDVETVWREADNLWNGVKKLKWGNR